MWITLAEELVRRSFDSLRLLRMTTLFDGSKNCNPNPNLAFLYFKNNIFTESFDMVSFLPV